MKNSILAICVALLGISLLSSCKKTIDDIKSNDKEFKPALFKQNIIAGLGTRNIGYTFVINHKGKMADSAARGWARMQQDGAIAHSIYKRMNIASVAKWMTAAGAMNLMAARGIPMHDSIYKYLPKYWSQGPGVKSVTFHEMLRHRSGLTMKDSTYGTSYEGLRKCISVGVINPAKSGKYDNGNFGMFRIMFLYMENPGAAASLEASFMATKDTLAFSTALSNAYISLMHKYLFTPAGVSNVTCVPEADRKMTLSYSEEDPSLNGYDFGDWTLTCGGGCFQLSAFETAKIMAYVYHTEGILTEGQRTLMENNRYGYDPEDGPNTSHGQSYGKDGALKAGSKGLQTIIMKFPAQVELVFFINSKKAEFEDYATVMKTAYENAWE